MSDVDARAGGDAARLDALFDAIDGVLAREEWDCSLPHKCAAAAMAIFGAPTGWQPIATAPRDGSDILLFAGQPIVGCWQLDPKGQPDGWHDAFNFRYEIEEPTHWQPLPAPPEVTP